MLRWISIFVDCVGARRVGAEWRGVDMEMGRVWACVGKRVLHCRAQHATTYVSANAGALTEHLWTEIAETTAFLPHVRS